MKSDPAPSRSPPGSPRTFVAMVAEGSNIGQFEDADAPWPASFSRDTVRKSMGTAAAYEPFSPSLPEHRKPDRDVSSTSLPSPLPRSVRLTSPHYHSNYTLDVRLGLLRMPTEL